MSVFLRTAGHHLLGTFAVPVAVFSGLIAFVILHFFVFMSDARTFGTFCALLFFSSVCYLSVRTLRRISKRGAQQVEVINAKEGLALNPGNLLGYPSPGLVVFDKGNRKLAFFNSATGDYKIHDFDYVLGWRYEWSMGQKMHVNPMGGPRIPGTILSQPTVSRSAYQKNFELVLELADENRPLVKFAMQNEAQALRWCATLNAVYNG